MTGADAHVGVQRGEGLVARFGAAAVVIGTTDAQTDPFASALLAALETRRTEPDGPATAFAWEVADLLATHRRQAPAFGLVLARGDGFQLLLHGDVHAVVHSAGSDLTLSGGNAGTWVDRVIDDGAQQISISLLAAPVVVDPRSDLRAGLVGGGGLVLRPRGRAADGGGPVAPLIPAIPVNAPIGRAGALATGPQPTVDRPSPPSVPQQSAPDAVGAPVTVTAGPATGSAATPATTPAPAAVTGPAPGLHRSEPGPRRPDRVVRAVEETAIVKTTNSALVADDGTRIPLDRHYVFGRDPSHDQAVLGGSASPIVVRDPDQVISRVQVHVSVVGDAVILRDNGSSNGTYIAAPGAAEWERLTDRPTPLPRGWSMRIGRRVYTYTP